MKITVKDPEALDNYLSGYTQGYDAGKYDILEFLYNELKDGGKEAPKEFIDHINKLFEHGGTQCN